MNLSRFFVLLTLASMACKPVFNAGGFPNTEALYAAAMREYNAKRYDNAVHAFERLTTELSPRDARIATAYLYLGKSQEKRGDHLLAAKSYSRIYELLPQDSLADDALYASGMAYQTMWRKPVLDAEYGQDAITQFQTLESLYPQSPLIKQADEQLQKLDEWFAEKDFSTGYHYLKRKAYDSAIIYFKDVIKLHPNAKKTREAYLRLHQAYTAINYKEDAKDLCAAMWKNYPGDRDIRDACGAPPAVAAPSQ